MIIVSGTLKIDPAKRADLLAAAHDLMVATRQEDGCITYAMVADPIDDDTVQVFEQWASPEALASHMTQNHMAAFGEKMGKVGGIRGADLQKHTVSESGPLG